MKKIILGLALVASMVISAMALACPACPCGSDCSCPPPCTCAKK